MSEKQHAHSNQPFEERYPWKMRAAIPRQGIFMDVGAGDGRDIVAVHEQAGGRLLVIGIDTREESYHKAVKANPGKDIVLCRSWYDVAGVKRNRQIAYLVADVNELPPPPSKLRADFTNCAGTVMFVSNDRREDFLKKLHELTKPYHDVFLRYQSDRLEPGMTPVEDRLLMNQARMAGFFIERVFDASYIPDTDFQVRWQDYLLTACDFKGPKAG